MRCFGGVLLFTIGILTASDKGSRGAREDKSAEVIRTLVNTLPCQVAKYEVVPDEAKIIADKLASWADGGIDVILTTGGTGLATRDVTPEATRSVIQREVPGIAEVMRAQTFSRSPLSVLSRAMAGVRGKCLIINLPGSPKAVHECLEVIIPVITHAVGIIKGEITEHPLTKG